MPTREDSPTLIATQPPLTTAKPVSTSVPTSTTKPTLALPTPIPIFDVGIANLAISQQGQLYASGFGGDLQQLPQQQLAQWDGTKWIALATGFQPASNSLAVDNAGHLLIAVLEIL